MITDRCPICDGSLRLVRERAEFTVGQRSASIDVDRFRCEACGEILYSPEQSETAQRAAADELRRQEKLLTPAGIREIRTKLSLTQMQFEQLLGVGPKTVVRWERGTVFQNRSTDQLIRLIGAVPAAFEFLAQRSGMRVVSEPPALYSKDDVKEVRFQVEQPQPARRRPSEPCVVSMDQFRRTQQKPITTEDEVPMPDIPKEALR